MLVGGGAALGALRRHRSSRTAMDWWLAHISMPVKRGISFAVDRCPSAPASWGATVLCLGALALLVRAVRRRRLADWGSAYRCAAGLGLCRGLRPVGRQYYGIGFAEKAEYDRAARQHQTLAAVTDWFCRKGQQETAPLTERDANGLFAVDKAEIFAAARGLYDPLTERWPFLSGPGAAPSLLSTQADERMGLHRLPLPAGRRKHTECRLAGGLSASDDRP